MLSVFSEGSQNTFKYSNFKAIYAPQSLNLIFRQFKLFFLSILICLPFQGEICLSKGRINHSFQHQRGFVEIFNSPNHQIKFLSFPLIDAHYFIKLSCFVDFDDLINAFCFETCIYVGCFRSNLMEFVHRVCLVIKFAHGLSNFWLARFFIGSILSTNEGLSMSKKLFLTQSQSLEDQECQKWIIMRVQCAFMLRFGILAWCLNMHDDSRKTYFLKITKQWVWIC